MSKNIAIILMNLGGPDCLKSVRPFLFNLFYDPAILAMPNPIRWILAQTISRLRTKKAQSIYEKMGGKSPLLKNSQAQAAALEQLLSVEKYTYKTFIAMRCWHPLTAETVAQVKTFEPDKVILLPLYPQYSTTTTGSSLQEWHHQAKKLGLTAPTYEVKNYYDEPNFIQAHIDLLLPVYKQAEAYGTPRILFSAHSLPQKVIDKGDPYQQQTEASVQAIVSRLTIPVDYQLCYQSRVGPIQWLTPTTEEALSQAAKEKVPVVVVPISFVSDHSETLVELDQDYKTFALTRGIPFYGRVPSLTCYPLFIKCLAEQVKENILNNSTT